MADVWEFRREWYSFTSVRFHLRSMSQVSARPWAGGNSIYGPHAQLWMPKLVSTAQGKSVWPDVSAFFSLIGGQAGLIRIGDPSRVTGRYNRERTATSQAFSDATRFSDGTGFIDGFNPPNVYVASAAVRGDVNVVIGGLLASTSGVLRPGDLIEFRPSGVADQTPRLHEVVIQGNSDSTGRAGVQIRPPLRTGLAAGDMAVLDYATSVFHLIDDTQGELEISGPAGGIANFGFSLVEAIENV